MATSVYTANVSEFPPRARTLPEQVAPASPKDEQRPAIRIERQHCLNLGC